MPEGGVERERRPARAYAQKSVQRADRRRWRPAAERVDASARSCRHWRRATRQHAASRCDGPGVRLDPLQHLGDSSRHRRERVEDVGRRDRAAERQHRRPGEPVAPHRQRRDEFRIAQPGGGAIDRGAARFVREQAGDLGVGEGLHETHDHGRGPDQEGERAGRAGDAADRKQDEGGNAARHPEGAAPIDRPNEFSFGRSTDRPAALAYPCSSFSLPVYENR